MKKNMLPILGTLGVLLVLGMFFKALKNMGLKSTPLEKVFELCAKGKIEKVKQILAMNPEMLEMRHEGETLLHVSIENNQKRMVQYFIKKGLLNKPNKKKTMPLQLALNKGHIDIVKYIISKEKLVDKEISSEGETPLSWAIKNENMPLLTWLTEQSPSLALKASLQQVIAKKNYKMAKFLIDKGAPLDSTLLHQAIDAKMYNLAKYLLQKKVDIKTLSKDGQSLLQKIMQDPQAASALLDSFLPKSDLEKKDKNGNTILFNAIAARATSKDWVPSVALIKKLISQKANVNAVCNKKQTPLHLAIKMNDIAIGKLLLESGATASPRDAQYKTPLHYTKTVSFARMLLSHGAYFEQSMLFNAAGISEALVRCFMERKGKLEYTLPVWDREQNKSIEYVDHKNRPIYRALQVGNRKLVKFFIDKGVKIAAKNTLQQTLMHQAALDNHKKAIRLLIDHRLKVYAKDFLGRTPLHFASQNASLELVKLLVTYGAKIDQKDITGQTPLHYASSKGKLKIAQFLLEKGADANAKDVRNSTPVHNATKAGAIDLVKLLLQKKADINASDYCGRKALDLANKDIKQLLLKNQAKAGKNVAHDPLQSQQTLQKTLNQIATTGDRKALVNLEKFVLLKIEEWHKKIFAPHLAQKIIFEYRKALYNYPKEQIPSNLIYYLRKGKCQVTRIDFIEQIKKGKVKNVNQVLRIMQNMKMAVPLFQVKMSKDTIVFFSYFNGKFYYLGKFNFWNYL